jgi:MFS family permease
MNAPPPLTPVRARWILLVTILASSVVFIDMTIVNLALPVMQLDTGSSFRAMQWVIEAYVLFLTALMLTGGGLADAFGRRRMMCTGAVIFGIASIWAGLSGSAGTLIAARALQGVGGALLAPASLAIVSAAFPPGERGRALGLWAAFSAVSIAFAPPLGGLLIELWSWRAVFFVNVPLLALVLLIAPWQVPESADYARGNDIDWWGSLTAIASLGLLTFGLLNAGESGLGNSLVITCLVGAVAFAIAFVMAERHAKSPMLPLSMFASRRFSGLNMMTLVLFTAVGAVMFFLPMTLIQSLDYSPLQAGGAMAPSMLVMFIVAPQIGRFTANTTDANFLRGMLLPIMLMGLGFGTWVTPLTSAVMSAAGDDRAGIASGINNAVSRLAQLLAIAFLGLLAATTFNATLDIQLVAAGFDADAIASLAGERIKLGAMSAPSTLPLELHDALGRAVATSFRQAFAEVAYTSTALCIVASIIGFWAIRRPA